jgi:nucleotide-binding universal stress UspA family protein
MDAVETNGTGRVIVVGVELTAKSDLALLTAVRMCTANDTLHVVHAVEVHALREAKRIQEQSEVLEHDPEVVRAYVCEVCEREEVWPLSRPEVHTRIGTPVATLVQFCTDVEADLLVCGTHPHTVIDKLRTPVSDGLMREAPCPVLVAKPLAYKGRRKSELPAPLCEDCVAKRKETGDPMSWCSTHAREHQGRHTYSGAGARKSVPPGFNMR